MKLRIKYMYESGSGTAAMEKVLTSGSFSDMLSQAEYSQKVHEYDRTQLQEYADTITQIEELQTTLESGKQRKRQLRRRQITIIIQITVQPITAGQQEVQLQEEAQEIVAEEVPVIQSHPMT